MLATKYMTRERLPERHHTWRQKVTIVDTISGRHCFYVDFGEYGDGRLAEIFFEGKGSKLNFLGHCYVKKEEYKTRKEQKRIDEDTKKFKLTYRKAHYKQLKD